MAISGTVSVDGGGKGLVHELYHFTAAASDTTAVIPTRLTRVVYYVASAFTGTSTVAGVDFHLKGTASTGTASKQYPGCMPVNGTVTLVWTSTAAMAVTVAMVGHH